MSFLVPASLVTFVAQTTRMATAKKPTPVISKTDEKAAIGQLIDDFYIALCARDVDRMMSHYYPDVIVFDVKLPFQSKGAIALRHIWEACLPFFPDTFQIEKRDLHITVGGDVAFAHFLFRLHAENNHPAAQTWLRATMGFRKQVGRWRVVHEHGSVPFNPHTMQAAFSLEI